MDVERADDSVNAYLRERTVIQAGERPCVTVAFTDGNGIFVASKPFGGGKGRTCHLAAFRSFKVRLDDQARCVGLRHLDRRYHRVGGRHNLFSLAFISDDECSSDSLVERHCYRYHSVVLRLVTENHRRDRGHCHRDQCVGERSVESRLRLAGSLVVERYMQLVVHTVGRHIGNGQAGEGLGCLGVRGERRCLGCIFVVIQPEGQGARLVEVLHVEGHRRYFVTGIYYRRSDVADGERRDDGLLDDGDCRARLRLTVSEGVVYRYRHGVRTRSECGRFGENDLIRQTAFLRGRYTVERDDKLVRRTLGNRERKLDFRSILDNRVNGREGYLRLGVDCHKQRVMDVERADNGVNTHLRERTVTQAGERPCVTVAFTDGNGIFVASKPFGGGKGRTCHLAAFRSFKVRLDDQARCVGLRHLDRRYHRVGGRNYGLGFAFISNDKCSSDSLVERHCYRYHGVVLRLVTENHRRDGGYCHRGQCVGERSVPKSYILRTTVGTVEGDMQGV